LFVFSVISSAVYATRHTTLDPSYSIYAFSPPSWAKARAQARQKPATDQQSIARIFFQSLQLIVGKIFLAFCKHTVAFNAGLPRMAEQKRLQH
jgi:hypothetical protein